MVRVPRAQTVCPEVLCTPPQHLVQNQQEDCMPLEAGVADSWAFRGLLAKNCAGGLNSLTLPSHATPGVSQSRIWPV